MRSITRNVAIAAAISATFAAGYYSAPRVQAVVQDTKSTLAMAIPAGAPQKLPATRTSDALDLPARLPQDTTLRGEWIQNSVPHDRAGAQALARKAFDDFSKHIQNVEAVGYNSPNEYIYFLPSHYSGVPGMCEATVISVDDRLGGRINSRELYLVIGRFESPPVVVDKNKPEYETYKRWENAIKANCAARDASSNWFTIDTKSPFIGDSGMESPKVFDGVIAAARTKGSLPFKLSCDSLGRITHFCDDPRKSLAAVDPKDINSISTQVFIHNWVGYETAIIETHGNPYVRAVISRTSPMVPGKSIVWTVTDVDIEDQMQPIVG